MVQPLGVVLVGGQAGGVGRDLLPGASHQVAARAAAPTRRGRAPHFPCHDSPHNQPPTPQPPQPPGLPIVGEVREPGFLEVGVGAVGRSVCGGWGLADHHQSMCVCLALALPHDVSRVAVLVTGALRSAFFHVSLPPPPPPPTPPYPPSPPASATQRQSRGPPPTNQPLAHASCGARRLLTRRSLAGAQHC